MKTEDVDKINKKYIDPISSIEYDRTAKDFIEGRLFSWFVLKTTEERHFSFPMELSQEDVDEIAGWKNWTDSEEYKFVIVNLKVHWKLKPHKSKRLMKQIFVKKNREWSESFLGIHEGRINENKSESKEEYRVYIWSDSERKFVRYSVENTLKDAQNAIIDILVKHKNLDLDPQVDLPRPWAQGPGSKAYSYDGTVYSNSGVHPRWISREQLDSIVDRKAARLRKRWPKLSEETKYELNHNPKFKKDIWQIGRQSHEGLIIYAEYNTFKDAQIGLFNQMAMNLLGELSPLIWILSPDDIFYYSSGAVYDRKARAAGARPDLPEWLDYDRIWRIVNKKLERLKKHPKKRDIKEDGPKIKKDIWQVLVWEREYPGYSVVAEHDNLKDAELALIDQMVKNKLKNFERASWILAPDNIEYSHDGSVWDNSNRTLLGDWISFGEIYDIVDRKVERLEKRKRTIESTLIEVIDRPRAIEGVWQLVGTAIPGGMTQKVVSRHKSLADAQNALIRAIAMDQIDEKHTGTFILSPDDKAYTSSGITIDRAKGGQGVDWIEWDLLQSIIQKKVARLKKHSNTRTNETVFDEPKDVWQVGHGILPHGILYSEHNSLKDAQSALINRMAKNHINKKSTTMRILSPDNKFYFSSGETFDLDNRRDLENWINSDDIKSIVKRKVERLKKHSKKQVKESLLLEYKARFDPDLDHTLWISPEGRIWSMNDERIHELSTPVEMEKWIRNYDLNSLKQPAVTHGNWMALNWERLFGTPFVEGENDPYEDPIKMGWIRIRNQSHQFNIQGKYESVKKLFKLWWPTVIEKMKDPAYQDDSLMVYMDYTTHDNRETFYFKLPRDKNKLIDWAQGRLELKSNIEEASKIDVKPSKWEAYSYRREGARITDDGPTISTRDKDYRAIDPYSHARHLIRQLPFRTFDSEKEALDFITSIYIRNFSKLYRYRWPTNSSLSDYFVKSPKGIKYYSSGRTSSPTERLKDWAPTHPSWEELPNNDEYYNDQVKQMAIKRMKRHIHRLTKDKKYRRFRIKEDNDNGVWSFWNHITGEETKYSSKNEALRALLNHKALDMYRTVYNTRKKNKDLGQPGPMLIHPDQNSYAIDKSQDDEHYSITGWVSNRGRVVGKWMNDYKEIERDQWTDQPDDDHINAWKWGKYFKRLMAKVHKRGTELNLEEAKRPDTTIDVKDFIAKKNVWTLAFWLPGPSGGRMDEPRYKIIKEFDNERDALLQLKEETIIWHILMRIEKIKKPNSGVNPSSWPGFYRPVVLDSEHHEYTDDGRIWTEYPNPGSSTTDIWLPEHSLNKLLDRAHKSTRFRKIMTPEYLKKYHPKDKSLIRPTDLTEEKLNPKGRLTSSDVQFIHPDVFGIMYSLDGVPIAWLTRDDDQTQEDLSAHRIYTVKKASNGLWVPDQPVTDISFLLPADTDLVDDTEEFNKPIRKVLKRLISLRQGSLKEQYNFYHQNLEWMFGITGKPDSEQWFDNKNDALKVLRAVVVSDYKNRGGFIRPPTVSSDRSAPRSLAYVKNDEEIYFSDGSMWRRGQVGTEQGYLGKWLRPKQIKMIADKKEVTEGNSFNSKKWQLVLMATRSDRHSQGTLKRFDNKNDALKALSDIVVANYKTHGTTTVEYNKRAYVMNRDEKYLYFSDGYIWPMGQVGYGVHSGTWLKPKQLKRLVAKKDVTEDATKEQWRSGTGNKEWPGSEPFANKNQALKALTKFIVNHHKKYNIPLSIKEEGEEWKHRPPVINMNHHVIVCVTNGEEMYFSDGTIHDTSGGLLKYLGRWLRPKQLKKFLAKKDITEAKLSDDSWVLSTPARLAHGRPNRRHSARGNENKLYPDKKTALNALKEKIKDSYKRYNRPGSSYVVFRSELYQSNGSIWSSPGGGDQTERLGVWLKPKQLKRLLSENITSEDIDKWYLRTPKLVSDIDFGGIRMDRKSDEISYPDRRTALNALKEKIKFSYEVYSHAGTSYVAHGSEIYQSNGTIWTADHSRPTERLGTWLKPKELTRLLSEEITEDIHKWYLRTPSYSRRTSFSNIEEYPDKRTALNALKEKIKFSLKQHGHQGTSYVEHGNELYQNDGVIYDVGPDAPMGGERLGRWIKPKQIKRQITNEDKLHNGEWWLIIGSNYDPSIYHKQFSDKKTALESLKNQMRSDYKLLGSHDPWEKDLREEFYYVSNGEEQYNSNGEIWNRSRQIVGHWIKPKQIRRQITNETSEYGFVMRYDSKNFTSEEDLNIKSGQWNLYRYDVFLPPQRFADNSRPSMPAQFVNLKLLSSHNNKGDALKELIKQYVLKAFERGESWARTDSGVESFPQGSRNGLQSKIVVLDSDHIVYYDTGQVRDIKFYDEWPGAAIPDNWISPSTLKKKIRSMIKSLGFKAKHDAARKSWGESINEAKEFWSFYRYTSNLNYRNEIVSLGVRQGQTRNRNIPKNFSLEQTFDNERDALKYLKHEIIKNALLSPGFSIPDALSSGLTPMHVLSDSGMFYSITGEKALMPYPESYLLSGQLEEPWYPKGYLNKWVKQAKKQKEFQNLKEDDTKKEWKFIEFVRQDQIYTEIRSFATKKEALREYYRQIMDGEIPIEDNHYVYVTSPGNGTSYFASGTIITKDASADNRTTIVGNWVKQDKVILRDMRKRVPRQSWPANSDFSPHAWAVNRYPRNLEESKKNKVFIDWYISFDGDGDLQTVIPAAGQAHTGVQKAPIKSQDIWTWSDLFNRKPQPGRAIDDQKHIVGYIGYWEGRPVKNFMNPEPMTFRILDLDKNLIRELNINMPRLPMNDIEKLMMRFVDRESKWILRASDKINKRKENLDLTEARHTGGDCYEVHARRIIESDENYTLVHGIATGLDGPIKGKQFGHCWLEYTANPGQRHTQVMVLDKSNNKDINLPADLYYRLGRIDPKQQHRYTADEVRVMLVKNEHWGPWETNVSPELQESIDYKYKNLIEDILLMIRGNINEYFYGSSTLRNLGYINSVESLWRRKHATWNVYKASDIYKSTVNAARSYAAIEDRQVKPHKIENMIRKEFTKVVSGIRESKNITEAVDDNYEKLIRTIELEVDYSVRAYLHGKRGLRLGYDDVEDMLWRRIQATWNDFKASDNYKKILGAVRNFENLAGRKIKPHKLEHMIKKQFTNNVSRIRESKNQIEEGKQLSKEKITISKAHKIKYILRKGGKLIVNHEVHRAYLWPSLKAYHATMAGELGMRDRVSYDIAKEFLQDTETYFVDKDRYGVIYHLTNKVAMEMHHGIVESKEQKLFINWESFINAETGINPDPDTIRTVARYLTDISGNIVGKYIYRLSKEPAQSTVDGHISYGTLKDKHDNIIVRRELDRGFVNRAHMEHWIQKHYKRLRSANSKYLDESKDDELNLHGKITKSKIKQYTGPDTYIVVYSMDNIPFADVLIHNNMATVFEVSAHQILVDKKRKIVYHTGATFSNRFYYKSDYELDKKIYKMRRKLIIARIKNDKENRERKAKLDNSYNMLEDNEKAMPGGNIIMTGHGDFIRFELDGIPLASAYKYIPGSKAHPESYRLWALGQDGADPDNYTLRKIVKREVSRKDLEKTVYKRRRQLIRIRDEPRKQHYEENSVS